MSFENFPYTDFHALNLDWIIKIVKECKTLSGETAVGLDDLKKYVNQYFSDLNLQNEVNNRLDEMAADGTLENIINQDLFSDLDNKISAVENEVTAVSENIGKLKDAYCKVTYLTLYAGLSALVDFYNGTNHKYMLIDGGTNNNQNFPFYYSGAAAFPKNDAQYTYDSIISRGIRHLDYAIVTHFHDDHIGGIGWAIKNKLLNSDSVIYYGGYIDSAKVDNSTGQFTHALGYQQEFASLCAANSIPTMALTSSTKLEINGTELTFKNCSDEYNYIYSISPTNPNYFSAIILFKFGDIYHMVSSDIPPEIQAHIVAWCKKVNVLQTPHHMSDTVLSMDFAKTVNPDVFLNSYGEGVFAICEKSAWRSVIRELMAKSYNTRYNDVGFLHTIYGTTIADSAPCMVNPPAYADGYFPGKSYSAGATTQTLTNMVAYNNNGTLFDFDSDTGKFTCKKDGYYIFTAQFNATTTVTETPHKVWCAIRNNDIPLGISQILTPDNFWTTVSAAAHLRAGEYITYTIENSSGNFTIPAGSTSRFKIILLN